MKMEKEKMKEMKEKYREGYDIYKSAIDITKQIKQFDKNETMDSPMWWAVRYATRTAVSEMAMWIHDTFDLTDEQKEELHSLMCHVGSD
jgi:hypothetical protein